MSSQLAVVAAYTDLVSLRLLAAIAETGSISAAGKRIGVSQQAASVRMRQLEARFGLALLDRTTRGSRLTPEGATVATWAADVVDAADRFQAGVAALRTQDPRPFAIAASLTIAEYLLPRWLMAMRAAQPTPRRQISVTATNSERVLDRVRDGTHQLGFIESPLQTGGLAVVAVARDELVLVVAPEHPWARRRSVSAAELARTPLVTRERGSGTRLSAERLLAEAGHTPVAPLVEFPTTAAIRTAVAAGAGPAILSILAVRDDLATGRLIRVRVGGVRFIRELRAVYQETSSEYGEAARLLEAITRFRSG